MISELQLYKVGQFYILTREMIASNSCYGKVIWESPPQFENQIMARVYVREHYA